jgi:hypothetical protein
MPIATVSSNGEPVHPVISWHPVSGATNYRVHILNINCRDGQPVLNNPLHISNDLTETSYSIPANVNVFSTGEPYAVWVQARELHDGILVNRSSFFTMYSAWQDGIPAEDLQAENGWSAYKKPDSEWIASNPTVNQLDVDISVTDSGLDHYWQWYKTVTGLRGMAATYTVDQAPQGDVGIGMVKNMAKLANGNIIRADIRLQYYMGDYFVRYRVREYDDDPFVELRRIADGHIGAGWTENGEYTLGLVLIGDKIKFFGQGVSNFCRSITVPIMGRFQPVSGYAGIYSYGYRENENINPSTISGQVRDVKLLTVEHLPVENSICDSDGDGKTGLQEAIHALQVTAGMH